MNSIDSLSAEEWLALAREAILMPDAPGQVIARALDLWRVPRQTPPALPLRWIALLTFDSWSVAPQAAGMRALPIDIRHLFFATEVCDIDLRIASKAAGYELSGQLLSAGTQGSVELAAIVDSVGTPRRQTVALDAQGEFRIDGVEGGIYLVTVRLEADEIVLPPIEVGARRGAGGP